MALISCPECNKEISDKAESCPNCGFPLNKVSLIQQVTSEENVTAPQNSAPIEEPYEKDMDKKQITSNNIIAATIVVGILLVSVIVSVVSNNNPVKSEKDAISFPASEIGILNSGASGLTEIITSSALLNNEGFDIPADSIDKFVYFFAENGLPVGNIKVYDKDTDPNSYLGKPGEYIAKVNFEDPRTLSLLQDVESDDYIPINTIELFNTSEDAKKRYDYLCDLEDESQNILISYKYLHENLLLRVGYSLASYEASAYSKQFKEALANLDQVLTTPVTNELIITNDDRDFPTGYTFITKAEFEFIDIGMSYIEVCRLIGSYGELTAETSKTKIFQWKGKDGGIASVSFTYDIATSKSQVGL